MSSILRSWLLALLVVAAPSASLAAAPPARKPVAAKPAAAGPAAAARAGARTLEDIHIEGEIPVPQVLFITARNQRRFLEFRHGHYLRSAQQLGEATAIPTRIVVSSPVTPAKESSR
ncbi:MAG: hypothetical protein IT348_14325 [Candidatus Eisenbacteria bacterium]|nr:hypothetical protein [Candidatus Eisenbacteria bacterium]